MMRTSALRSSDRHSLADLLVQIDSSLLRAQNGEEILGALHPVFARFQPSGAQLYFLYADSANCPVSARLVAIANALGEPQSFDHLPATTLRLADYPFSLQVIKQRQPYFVENIFTHPKADEQTRALARLFNYTAAIALPLFVNERWLGLLVLQWQQPQVFGDAVKIFFKTLQSNIAAVLAGYRSALEREEAYREIELLYRIGSLVNAAQSYADLVQAVGQHAPLGSFTISITHFENYDLKRATYAEIAAVWGAKPERVGTRVYDGLPVPFVERQVMQVVSDTSDPNQVTEAVRQVMRACGYAAYLSVPLTFGTTVLGALNFFSDKPREYSQAEQRLAKGIADLVAVAMDRIRLREDSLRVQRRTERIAQINAALLTASDEEQIVSAFAEYAAELEAECVALGYLENSADSACIVRVVAVYSPQAQSTPSVSVGSRYEFDEIFKQRAQQLVLIEDTRHDERLTPRERALSLEHGAQALALLFLRSSSELIGVLSFNWRTTRTFTADERAVFEAILPSLAAVVGRRQLWLKQAQMLEKLRQMDRLKDEFLSNMSHELRTPLNAVIGLSDVILQGMDGELTPRLQQDIQTIYDAGQQLLSIVNDVLDIAKIEAGALTLRLEQIDLREPLQEALKTAHVMAANKHLSLCASLPDYPLKVRADASRMRQVALNLLSNAIKFTDVGHIWLRACIQNGEIVFCVKDEGIGIAPEHHALIFEQFRQVEGSLHRRKGGAGLGLAISKRLIELHGGRIWLESALGKGATFYVSLPSC
ncbi:MAG: GAF domain-containing sensor histidine kinase [Anaerolineae bacterium]|nr:GAF domain-containing sensor histidine kinase [Anaerolineae bacterium]